MNGYDVFADQLRGVERALAVSAPSESTNSNSGKTACAQPQPTPEAVREAYADNLRNMTAATFLYSTVASSLSGSIDPHAVKLYRDRLLEDAGNPTDPIAVMLIEQLAMAHFSIGQLRMKACSIENPKLAVAYTDAATRLLGEFRRCTLAIEEYRAKQAERKDRNTATAGVEEKPPAKRNGKPRVSTNGKTPASRKKKSAYSKQPTNGEIPKCLRERMGFAASGVLKPTAATGANGKG